ncbi:MAG TPA: hypothetical protein DCZ88_03010 [Pseudanabaena sp.]|nr:hypothetical protein [Pseudanabaena sp.]
MDNNLPVKFLWGVFCRRVITDRDTGEISMIDIMPALNLEQIVPIKIDDKIPEFSINLGKSYVTALIEKSDFDGHEINKELSIEFVQSGLKSVFVKTNLNIRSTDNSTFVNLDLRDLILTINSLDYDFDYSFEVIYRIQEQELGRVKLPVKVKFKALEDE